MIDFLMTKAYELYPRNISGLDDNYNKAEESIRLRSMLKKRIADDYNLWKDLIEELRSKSLHVLDKTSFTTNQPSLAFALILEKKDNGISVVHVYYSGLIPYFYYAHVIHNIEKDLALAEISVNHSETFLNTGIDVVSLIKERFAISLFPEKYLTIKVPDVSFEAIKTGDFTFKNAFFNTRYLI